MTMKVIQYNADDCFTCADCALNMKTGTYTFNGAFILNGISTFKSDTLPNTVYFVKKLLVSNSLDQLQAVLFDVLVINFIIIENCKPLIFLAIVSTLLMLGKHFP